MSFLVVLLGFALGFWGLAFIVLVADGATDALTGWLIMFIIILVAFLYCLKKYRSPEYQAKLKKAQEDWQASAPERERIRQEEKERKRERERLRTTIVSTRLIGEGSPGKGVGNMLKRGAIGSILAGSAGAAIGVATAKNDKNVRRFLVKYLDGHIEEKEATIGSRMYEEYMAHLEWEA